MMKSEILVCSCPACSAAPMLGDAAGHPTNLAAGTADPITGLLAGIGKRWNADSPVGTDVTLTYSFRDTLPATYPPTPDGDPTTSFVPFTAAARSDVRGLLAYVADTVGVHFVEVADGSNATIEIGAFDVQYGYTGISYYPYGTPMAPRGSGGDLWIATQQLNRVGPGSYFEQLFLHELGHALGLKHTFGGASYEQLPEALDRPQFSVMTYQNYGDLAKNLVPTWSGGTVQMQWLYRGTYGPLDVQALTYLYGNGTAHGGDDVYRFDARAVMTTIVDSGGHDVFDASSTDLPSIIDLTPGASSSIGIRTQAQWLDLLAAQGMPDWYRARASDALAARATELFTGRNDVAIAVNSTIEDAIGGGGADLISGNGANNRLTGGGGDDVLDGGAGIDTAVYALGWSNYTLAWNGGDFDVTAKIGNEGHDHLHAIERVRFSDGVLMLDGGPNGATAYRLYQAALARIPDEAGLRVQIHALDTGTTLLQLASAFLGSAEFRGKYGALDDTGYATALYSNVLGRTPDLPGLAVQVDALQHGLARDQLLLNFSESAENRQKTAPLTVVGLFASIVDPTYG